jgi:hypothetical protein
MALTLIIFEMASGICDFDRAVSLAAQFDRQELRMMAQLKLAQGILAGPKARMLLPYLDF